MLVWLLTLGTRFSHWEPRFPPGQPDMKLREATCVKRLSRCLTQAAGINPPEAPFSSSVTRCAVTQAPPGTLRPLRRACMVSLPRHLPAMAGPVQVDASPTPPDAWGLVL